MRRSFGVAPRARAVLEGVDLVLEPGTLTLLGGPSGSGKSTLLAIAAGLLDADSGRVLIGDREPWRARGAQVASFRRRHVGFVFQTGRMLPGLAVLDNVALPLTFERRDEAGPRTREALHRFGIGDLADAMPESLSVGELQRASVARALIAEPSVVFADEPTSSLDADSARVVLTALRDAADDGATVLIASHDSALARPGDRQVTLRKGLIE